MTVIITLIVTVVGLLMYALSNQPKVAEIGRIMFFCGLLAFLLSDIHTLALHTPT